MSSILCASCMALGYCRKKRVKMVRESHLENPDYLRDVRATAFELGIGYRRWHEFIVTEYMAFDGTIVGPNGDEVYLDTSVFETRSIDYWFRDFCCRPCLPDTRPRLRSAAKRRVVVLATILKARLPRKALLWGVRPSNDNSVTEAANDA